MSGLENFRRGRERDRTRSCRSPDSGNVGDAQQSARFSRVGVYRGTTESGAVPMQPLAATCGAAGWYDKTIGLNAVVIPVTWTDNGLRLRN